MALQYTYVYAQIDPATNMCIGVFSSDYPREVSDTLVEIPVKDPEYCLKYYINGIWYEDAAGTIPWTSSML